VAFADLSVEVAHTYLGGATPEQLRRTAFVAATYVKPVVASYQERGRTVSTCVLIDDYFGSSDEMSSTEAAEVTVSACAKAGLTVHHIVREAACAETVEQLIERIRPEPEPDVGTQFEPLEKVGWLANGARSLRQRPSIRVAGEPPDPNERVALAPSSFGRRQHTIFLDVELWSQRPDTTRLYSCPLLAAWWQMVRLGMLRNSGGRPIAPTDTTSLSDAPPLAARRTLTVLDPAFLEVEHAVRSILSQVDLPADWKRSLQTSRTPATPTTHLERIAYMFIADSFDSCPRG
jgi:hypothetical protein